MFSAKVNKYTSLFETKVLTIRRVALLPRHRRFVDGASKATWSQSRGFEKAL